MSCVLIPGAASRSWHSSLLAERVRTHGQQIVTVDLPVDDAAGLADDCQTTPAQSSTPSAGLSGAGAEGGSPPDTSQPWRKP